MIFIAARFAAQNFLCQQRLAPQSDESLRVEIFWMQRPEPHKIADSLADAAFARADELDQVQNFRQLGQFLFDFRERIRNRQSFAK